MQGALSRAMIVGGTIIDDSIVQNVVQGKNRVEFKVIKRLSGATELWFEMGYFSRRSMYPWTL